MPQQSQEKLFVTTHYDERLSRGQSSPTLRGAVVGFHRVHFERTHRISQSPSLRYEIRKGKRRLDIDVATLINTRPQ